MKAKIKNDIYDKNDRLREKIVDENSSHICKVDREKDVMDITADENNTLSKRPWSNGAREVICALPDGSTRSCWISSVVDANGNTVCFGKAADMKFITAMENAIPKIAKMLESNKSSMEDALNFLHSISKASEKKTV